MQGPTNILQMLRMGRQPGLSGQMPREKFQQGTGPKGQKLGAAPHLQMMPRGNQ